MSNFVYKIRCALARFMYGRNGVDQLGRMMLYGIVALCVVRMFVLRVPIAVSILSLAETVLWVLLLCRMFSKNLTKRRAENAKFMAWWEPKRNELRGAKMRRADTAHKYVRCSCGTYCRVPRNVGKVELTCPKCGAKRVVKT